MKILITGACGFIGSHTCRVLIQQGHQIIALDDLNDYYDVDIKRKNLAEMLPEASFIEGDIRDKNIVKQAFSHGVDAVIHLAARAGVRSSISDPEIYISTNIIGTYNLLEAAHCHKVNKFIFASSSSVYGINSKVPFTEDDLVQNTISPYAMTKLAGEQLCSNFSHLYNIQCICLRFFTVYGERQRPDLAIHKFTDLIYNNKQIEIYGDGSTARDYTHIDDIVKGIILALHTSTYKFNIFNIGSSQPTKLRDLILYISAAFNKTPQIVYRPDQPGDVPYTFADISKATALLGYTPQTHISEGIPKFVEWYRLTHK